MFFRPEFCLELPLASTSRWGALLLTNGWRSLPPFGTFTLEFYTMPGTQKGLLAQAINPFNFKYIYFSTTSF